MKYTSGFKAIAASVVLGVTLSASSVLANEVDYAATSSSFINFDGSSHFSFSPSTASFAISGGTANAITGEISGLFTIGAITAGDAPVTGSGTFTINDGATPFSATLTWGDIYTHGTGSTLNDVGTINLTGITYLGSNPDLVTLAGSGSGYNVLTFQFTPPAPTLTQLANSTYQTTFSGSLNPVVPDGGTTIALMGGALLAIGGLRRKIGR